MSYAPQHPNHMSYAPCSQHPCYPSLSPTSYAAPGTIHPTSYTLQPFPTPHTLLWPLEDRILCRLLHVRFVLRRRLLFDGAQLVVPVSVLF